MTSFGPLAGLQNVKEAIVSLLSQPPTDGQAPLIVYYLAAVERENGLAPHTLPVPPGDDSFYGGVDFESWDEAYLPTVIVVTQPIDPPQRFGDGSHAQWFESQIGAIVQGDDEDQAQMFAAYYGTAISGAILQNRDLNGVAINTVLSEAPSVELLDESTSRAFARSTLRVRSLIIPIVVDDAWPPDWAFDPYGAVPQDAEAEEVNVTVSVEPLPGD